MAADQSTTEPTMTDVAGQVVHVGDTVAVIDPVAGPRQRLARVEEIHEVVMSGGSLALRAVIDGSRFAGSREIVRVMTDDERAGITVLNEAACAAIKKLAGPVHRDIVDPLIDGVGATNKLVR